MRAQGGRARIVLAGAAWAAVLACVPHPSADPACEGNATVTGGRFAVFVTPTGEQSRVFTTPQTTAALLPLPGGGRGYVTCSGTDDGKGHLSVPKVPDGAKYYFQLGTTYVETSQRDVDFTDFFVGRPDAVAARLSTPVTLQGASLESWSSQNDAVGLYSWGARTFELGVERVGSGLPSDGATSLAINFDWSQLTGQRLLDAAQGDQLLVTQYAQRNITGGTAQVAAKGFVLSNTTLRDGQSATLSGSFADLPATRTFSIDWKRSAFDGPSADVAPDATLASQSLFVLGMPGGTQHGHYDFAMELLQTGFGVAGATDKVLGASVPIPPSGFTLIVEAQEDFDVTRTFHGASETTRGFVYVEDLLDHADRGSLSPATGPVKMPRLAGKDAFTVQSGVGITPPISWVPGLATDVVRVTVNHMKTTGGIVGHETAAVIFTQSSSVDIPDGVLKSGETYYLFIDSMTSAGASFDRAPFRAGEPTTIVRVVGETFTP